MLPEKGYHFPSGNVSSLYMRRHDFLAIKDRMIMFIKVTSGCKSMLLRVLLAYGSTYGNRQH